MTVDIPADARTGPPAAIDILGVVLTMVILGGAAVWITARTPDDLKVAIGVFGAAATALVCVCLATALYNVRRSRRYRVRLTAADLGSYRFANETVPTMLGQLRAGEPVNNVLLQAQQDSLDHRPYQYVLSSIAKHIGDERRMRAAVMAACANAAGRVQALSTSMLADLRDMEARHDERVLGDLLKLDHSTAQAGRLADSIAVLTGVRSGRRWTKPIIVESILRGAIGRISAYQRVRVHSTSTAAVAGHAAEGVMHALAELLDNATSFSPPSEEVHVYVEEVQAGLVLAIEDGGLGMKPAMLERAEKAISAEPLDLTTLSGTRLGLAVVGCLARKHDLKVFFRPSSRGGTGVVVMIPRPLITEMHRNAIPPAAAEKGSDEGTELPRDVGRDDAQPQQQEVGPAGLPKRRRGETLAAAGRSGTAPTMTSPTPRRDASSRFREFRLASRGNRPPQWPGESDESPT